MITFIFLTRVHHIRLQRSKQVKLNEIKVYDFYNLKGKVDTLHELLKYSSFDIIALIDVDDIWLKNKLNKQIHTKF